MRLYIDDLNNTKNQLGLINIYRILHPTGAEYILLSSTHKRVSKIDHILAQTCISIHLK